MKSIFMYAYVCGKKNSGVLYKSLAVFWTGSLKGTTKHFNQQLS